MPITGFDAVLAKLHGAGLKRRGTNVADALTDRQRKAIRPQIVGEAYGPNVLADLEPQPYFGWPSKVGPVLCLRDGGQIADAGDRLTASGRMDDEKAILG